MLVNRLLILGLIFTIACSNQPILDGFDRQNWQADTNGCNKQRITLTDEIMSRKDELIELGQNDIIEVFGKPDRHELYSRNKKAFIYYINDAPDCNQVKENLHQSMVSNKSGRQADKLVIRFDGVGRTKEIILYKN